MTLAVPTVIGLCESAETIQPGVIHTALFPEAIPASVSRSPCPISVPMDEIHGQSHFSGWDDCNLQYSIFKYPVIGGDLQISPRV